MTEHVGRIFTDGLRTRWILLAATLVSLPALGLGFVIDDYFHVWLVEGGGLPAALELFTFSDGDPTNNALRREEGPYPWWTLDELRLKFLRPLSGFTHWLDYQLFGRWTLPMHLHSVAWHLGVVAVATAALRRLLPVGVAGLAAVLFAVDDAHALPALWLANRNALVAFGIALAGVLAHLRWRQDGWTPGALLGPLLLGLGLLGGEPALGAFAYLGAYELVGRDEPLAARAQALLGPVAVGAAWVVAYKLGRFGAWGSGIYLDPTAQPVDWLMAAPMRLLAEAGNLLASVPIDFWMLLPELQPVIVGSGVLAVLVTAAIVKLAWPSVPAETRRGLGVLLLGSLLSLLPVISTFPSARLLLAASLGSAALVAAVIVAAWEARGRLLVAAAGLLSFVHGVWSPAGWWLQAWVVDTLDEGLVEASLELPLDDDVVAEQYVSVVAPPDPMISIYAGLLWIHHGRTGGRAWWPLSMSTNTHRVRRTAADAFELTWVDGPMLTTVYEQLFRDPTHPLLAGERIELDHFTVEVLADDGTWPTKARFTYDRPLDDPTLLFLAWDEGAFQAIDWPPVGGELSWDVEPGPMTPEL